VKIKYFIGPMSKLVVDSIIEFSKKTGNTIGLIPSRRQVEYNGGYVNNWTTEAFKKYTNDFFVTRDHGGPGQGLKMDDGYESLRIDCKHLDMIHIDPWKKYPQYEEGLKKTIEMIKFCHKENSNIYFEVGTEESIRRFTANEIDQLLTDLKNALETEEYNQILYCVIQSGTSLKGNVNTGLYDTERLVSMIEVVQNHGFLSKEHNGDYLPASLIKEKFSLGLDSINIAPEFGQIETKTYLEKIKNEKPELLDMLWAICYESRRWEKWIDNDFDPLKQKEELINICGHYVLSYPDFQKEIKSKFDDIDEEIKNNIKKKLETLFNG